MLFRSFNEGNIGKFEALAPLFPKEPILQENYSFMRQKICLMALIEAAFKRNGNERSMTFKTIAAETRLPDQEVEHLVMKALRLGFDHLFSRKLTRSLRQSQTYSRLS